MSAEAESLLFDPRGAVHTGTGNQFNGVTFNIDSTQRLRVARDSRTVGQEHLRWLRRRFREPVHYGRARELLADSGSVLLTGAPGSGRRAAAQMLLHLLPAADGEIRELPATSDSPEEPVLDGGVVDSGHRLLLDLSLGTETEHGAVLCELTSFRTLVRERGAYLVVVLPHHQGHQLLSELGPSVQIARPDGAEVFQCYLRSEEIAFRAEQLGGTELTVLLRSEPMRRVAQLAALVHLARESAPAGAFPSWLRAALGALTERGEEVARQLTELRAGPQRALLLATAMFSGAPADAVVQAAARLRAVVGHPEDDRPRLEREGVAEQLAEIGAGTDDAGRARFAALAYDPAVRTHFWTNFPDLREGLRDWVQSAIAQRTLTAADRDEVVTRFAEQALRTGRPGDLLRVAERWIGHGDPRSPSSLLPQGAKALERGLSDPRHGWIFRRQLYTWSRDPGLPPDLAQVVVQLCAEVLALNHPHQAVVRLHHLVRRQSGMAGDAARDALLDLADRSRGLYRLLLERVTSTPKKTEDIPADLALFLDLADPDRVTGSVHRTRPLLADEAVRGQLVAGWATALSGPSSLPGRRQVRAWLAACEDDRHREPLLDVLVSAGEGHDEVLSRLYVLARDWAHAPGEHREERMAIAARLTDMIDSAQGVDLTAPGPGHRIEGTTP